MRNPLTCLFVDDLPDFLYVPSADILRVAQIVHGADTSRLDLTPQSGGLYAITLGPSYNFSDDHEMLRHGMVMYDALYAWCRLQAGG